MSEWTHINFVAEVRGPLCNSKSELKDQITENIKDLRIEGSEGPADVFVNIPEDSDWTKYYQSETTYGWSMAYITICGHLRDRDIGEIQMDVDWLIKRLKQKFSYVRNITYKIYADGEELDYFRDLEK